MKPTLVGGVLPERGAIDTSTPEGRYQHAKRVELDALDSALGPTVLRAFIEEDVTEVLYDNGGGTLWVDRRTDGLVGQRVEFTTEDAEYLFGVLRGLLDLDDPIELAGHLPFIGHRVHAIKPPVSVHGITWSIRKHASAIYPLEAFCGAEAGEVEAILAAALTQRANILLVGGVGSGKTSFLNRLLVMAAEAARAHGQVERHVICEDTLELKAASPATVRLVTSETHDLTALVQSCLRLRPDRIVIGEVRGKEALAALKSWNTGTPGGMFTVHANSAKEGLLRLEQLTLEASAGPQHLLIGQTVDVVVQLCRRGGVRELAEILEVEGNNGAPGGYTTRALYEKGAKDAT